MASSQGQPIESVIPTLDWLLDRHELEPLIDLLRARAAERRSLAALPPGPLSQLVDPLQGFSAVADSTGLFLHPSNGYGSDNAAVFDAVSADGMAAVSDATGMIQDDQRSEHLQGPGVAFSPVAGQRRRPAARKTPSSRAAKQASTKAPAVAMACCLCWEYGILVKFQRKQEFKRHLKKFHVSSSCSYRCNVSGCRMVFDIKSAFDAHAKENHKGVYQSTKNCMTETCPQQNFACGFGTCREVFEVADGESPAAVAEEFFDHILAHYSSGRTHTGPTHTEWSYSVRFRNLLRQKALDGAYDNRRKVGTEPKPEWERQSSYNLCKVLETRHVRQGDAPVLVEWAVKLGSASAGSMESVLWETPFGISFPWKAECRVYHAYTDYSEAAETETVLSATDDPAAGAQMKSHFDSTWVPDLGPFHGSYASQHTTNYPQGGLDFSASFLDTDPGVQASAVLNAQYQGAPPSAQGYPAWPPGQPFADIMNQFGRNANRLANAPAIPGAFVQTLHTPQGTTAGHGPYGPTAPSMASSFGDQPMEQDDEYP